MAPHFVFSHSIGLGRPVTLKPHAVSTCDLGIGEQTYLLRVRNELLYFSTHPQTDDSPVWTTFEPVPPKFQRSEANLIFWWRHEVEAGRFGLIHNTFIWGCYGYGQYRPWWDASGGEPFEWPNCDAAQPLSLLNESLCGLDTSIRPRLWSNRQELLFRRLWFDPFILSDEQKLWQKIPPSRVVDGIITRAMKRERPAHLVKDLSFQWRRGTLPEFEALTRAIAHNVPSVWEHFHTLDFWGSTNTPSDGDWRVMQNMNTGETDAYGWYASNAEPLLSLLFYDFSPYGWQWKRGVEKWGCHGLQFRLSVTAPSQHEQLEARLLIRDWLSSLVERGNLSPQDAQMLLGWPPDEDGDRWLCERERILAPFEAQMAEELNW